MAGLDRVINPETGDYVETAEGQWETTRNAQTAIYHQIRTKRNGWAGDPDAGSDFHELDRGKSTLRTPVVIRDMTERALAPLVDEGRITEPDIDVERDGTRAAQEATVTDLQSKEEIGLASILASVV